MVNSPCLGACNSAAVVAYVWLIRHVWARTISAAIGACVWLIRHVWAHAVSANKFSSKAFLENYPHKLLGCADIIICGMHSWGWAHALTLLFGCVRLIRHVWTRAISAAIVACLQLIRHVWVRAISAAVVAYVWLIRHVWAHAISANKFSSKAFLENYPHKLLGCADIIMCGMHR